jgi:hypothetical protein
MSEKLRDMSLLILDSVKCILAQNVDGQTDHLSPEERKTHAALAGLVQKVFNELPHNPESKDSKRAMRDYAQAVEIVLQQLIKTRYFRIYKQKLH